VSAVEIALHVDPPAVCAWNGDVSAFQPVWRMPAVDQAEFVALFSAAEIMALLFSP
jgi:hypothetical protein